MSLKATTASLRAAALWQRHRWADRFVTLATMVVTEILLRSVGLARTARVLGIPIGESDSSAGALDVWTLEPWARSRLRSVSAMTARWPFGDTCLRRSLVAAHRLRRLSPEVMVGVRIVEGRLEAHAWLRLDGQDLDAEASEYQVIGASGPAS